MANGENEIPSDLTPQWFEFSTDLVAEKERFDYFNDMVANQYLGFDSAETPGTSFMGRMRARAIGEALVTQNVSSEARWVRSRRSLLDDDEFVMVALLQAGSARIKQADRDFLLRPGSAAIFASTIASDIEILEPSKSLTLRLPRHLLETALRPGLTVKPTMLSLADPTMKLAVHYMRSLAHFGHELAPDAAVLAGQHISHLIASAMNWHPDERSEPAVSGKAAAQTNAILKIISVRYPDTQISPQAIAKELGISSRQVHRLLEKTNRTFQEHLQEARLSAAYRALRDPLLQRRNIQDIAASVGFAEVTHFNRAFKTRFGATPSEIRARA